MILNLGDPWRRPCSPFGNIPFVPGPDLATEDHPAAFGLDVYPRCLDLSTALQGLLDLFPDVGGASRRGNPDLVDNVDDAAELVHNLLGIVFLILPIDIAGQRHDPLLNLHADAIGRKADLPFQYIDRACGDLVIRALRVRRQAHLDLFGDRLNALHPPRGALCSCFLSVARDKAGQGHDPLFAATPMWAALMLGSNSSSSRTSWRSCKSPIIATSIGQQSRKTSADPEV